MHRAKWNRSFLLLGLLGMFGQDCFRRVEDGPMTSALARPERSLTFARNDGGAEIAVDESAFAGRSGAQNNADWTEAFPPHRVVGNVYYVGSRGLASYLITTPKGHILINSSMESNVQMIAESIERLGFHFVDVKILLISHAHWDHCGGSALLKKLTGAKYMVMDADVPVIESGGKKDFQYGNSPDNLYQPAKVDRVLHDGDEVNLGNAVLVARKTPGHTKGCTTWTMRVSDAGKEYDVVIVGSPNVNPGYKLVNNTQYPQIVEDYEHTFRVLKALPCDIFLGAHGDYYGIAEKVGRIKEGAPNPFIDPQGYKNYVADRERAFLEDLKKQQELSGPAAQ